jgi:hypothetical protein
VGPSGGCPNKRGFDLEVLLGVIRSPDFTTKDLLSDNLTMGARRNPDTISSDVDLSSTLSFIAMILRHWLLEFDRERIADDSVFLLPMWIGD